jgi:hypothetical protein
MSSELISKEVIAKELKISKLLEETVRIGGIFKMGYSECSILTNDKWKQKACGVPKHCFLLATVMDPKKMPENEDDEEIILLRVIGSADLPTEKDLINIRSDAMREILTHSGSEAIEDPSTVLDVLTKNEIQFSGIRAKVIGTFYEKIVEKRRILKFGSDIDNFYAVSKYKVYKPYGESLSIIASYPEITEKEEKERQLADEEKIEYHSNRVQIGTVRYSSTERRSNKYAEERNISVPVKINIKDFISMKTAIFGMTRMGKSNTIKIISTATFKYSILNNEEIGQLIFDTTGEYTNVNPQDQTAISQISEDHVVIFKYGIENETKNLKSLNINFFQQNLIEEVWAIIESYVRDEAPSHYLRRLSEVDVIGPEDFNDNPSEYFRARRRRSALYATLIKAGFKIPNNFHITIRANAEVVDALNETLAESDQYTTDKGKIVLNKTNIIRWWDRITELWRQDNNSVTGGDSPWVDEQLATILEIYGRQRGRIGYTILEPLRKYHSPNITVDYMDIVIKELKKGKIVIVDLSFGNETVLQFCTERIIHGIIRMASRRFRRNKKAIKIQIFIEEAHRLFNRNRFEKPDPNDPYVRLAKEAAKYKIGLVYATQEITSVDSQVLANTSNWMVTHLNNRKEIKELSKFYDFKDFDKQIINAEDVGFARIKTKSGRFIIPVQIDLFDKDRVDDAKRLVQSLSTQESD